ncbi:hypothetical protein BDZ90DRAFT_280491 [Jaminaea rosea]|uniref:Uncharacterized protein n=1 Tax=Jaminaea rosea TaxID=1569628 RepID=A0A316UMD4_9BASI|nr:hypothetical protein BDZ90DRAFT_280491 [Jaminaea rosea]PWN26452.1 hypothetical protein BDZ90DRAFT_280491 [Jaminaea rosea]
MLLAISTSFITLAFVRPVLSQGECQRLVDKHCIYGPDFSHLVEPMFVNTTRGEVLRESRGGGGSQTFLLDDHSDGFIAVHCLGVDKDESLEFSFDGNLSFVVGPTVEGKAWASFSNNPRKVGKGQEQGSRTKGVDLFVGCY